MPFDPSLPANGTPTSSAVMRGQLTGLFDLIQTIPVGPAGPAGPPGTSVSGAVVDGVLSVPAGGAATAGASFDGANVRFTFGLPRGDVGETGAPGGPGPQGIQGEVGPVGPPFTSFNVASTTTLDPAQPATASAFFDGASVRFNFGLPRGVDGLPGPAGPTGATGPAFTSFTVDAVTTLASGQPATVTASFDGTFVRFAFGIPQGPPGNQGNNGFDGAQGPPGPPGEVTAAQLAGAIAGTSNNPGVTNLALTASDPPTQSELQQVIDKVNELMNALRRPVP